MTELQNITVDDILLPVVSNIETTATVKYKINGEPVILSFHVLIYVTNVSIYEPEYKFMETGHGYFTASFNRLKELKKFIIDFVKNGCNLPKKVD